MIAEIGHLALVITFMLAIVPVDPAALWCRTA